MGHEKWADIIVELAGVLPHQDRQNRQVFPVPKHIIDFFRIIFLLRKFTLVCLQLPIYYGRDCDWPPESGSVILNYEYRTVLVRILTVKIERN